MQQFGFIGFFDIFWVTKCDKVILLQSLTGFYCKVSHALQKVTVVRKSYVTQVIKLFGLLSKFVR